MESARASAQREEERRLQQTQTARRQDEHMRSSVASKLVTASAMFVLMDEDHNGFLSRDSFGKATAHLGLDKRAAMSVFRELDVFEGRGNDPDWQLYGSNQPAGTLAARTFL